MVDERLTQFLKDGKDWERKATSVPGVFLLRLLAFRSRTSSVAIEINPVDSAGAATKKRGIAIRSRIEYDQIRNILGNDKISELASSIDEVNPEIKSVSKNSKEDIFEI
jgi:hypothetical protein